LHASLDEGYRFFDTSNVYAQGDSERYIGKVIANRSDCIVCTKGGKYLPLTKRIFVPLKGMLRGVTRRSGAARGGVANARSQPLPMRWDTAFLGDSIDRSLRRLRRERIDIYLLHGASADVLQQGDAIDALERAHTAGKVGLIGVSVDDVIAAEAALLDKRIRVLQVPLHPGSEHYYQQCVMSAQQQGVGIIAREILGGAAAISGMQNPSGYVSARIQAMVSDPAIMMSLIGTTQINNMKSAALAARGVLRRPATDATRPEIHS
jgi:aryl-alcohol dehydrogenase-like predicted oxidoreductase